jgi:MFS family permease
LQLSLLTGVLTASALAGNAASPLQEAMRVALGLSDSQMALLQGPAMAIPLGLGSIPLGLLIDRHSRVRLIFVATALTFIGSLLTALVSTFAMLVALRALVGLASFAMGMAVVSMMADLYPPEQRGRAYMVTSFSAVLGVPDGR